MVQLLKKPKINVVTEGGSGECEVVISLDLNINLNINGTSIDVSAEEKVVKQDPFIPDFGIEKIKFGEKG